MVSGITVGVGGRIQKVMQLDLDFSRGAQLWTATTVLQIAPLFVMASSRLYHDSQIARVVASVAANSAISSHHASPGTTRRTRDDDELEAQLDRDLYEQMMEAGKPELNDEVVIPAGVSHAEEDIRHCIDHQRKWHTINKTGTN